VWENRQRRADRPRDGARPRKRAERWSVATRSLTRSPNAPGRGRRSRVWQPWPPLRSSSWVRLRHSTLGRILRDWSGRQSHHHSCQRGPTQVLACGSSFLPPFPSSASRAAIPLVRFGPTTPSLPWKDGGVSNVHSRSLAGTKCLQSAGSRSERPWRPESGRGETGGRNVDGKPATPHRRISRADLGLTRLIAGGPPGPPDAD
jgi:hypothetical protein